VNTLIVFDPECDLKRLAGVVGIGAPATRSRPIRPFSRSLRSITRIRSFLVNQREAFDKMQCLRNTARRTGWVRP